MEPTESIVNVEPGTSPPVLFNDTSIAFAHKNDKEVLMSYLLFWMMSKPILVKVLSNLTKFALKIHLPVRSLIKFTVYRQFCGGENKMEFTSVISKLGESGIGTILDYSVEGVESEEKFDQTKLELLRIVDLAKDNPHIPCTCMKVTGIGRFKLLEKASRGTALTKGEEGEYHRILLRLDQICKASHALNKPIYIDAEESWIQDAIDAMAEEMMERYNDGRAIVFTTIQMYRHDRNAYFQRLIQLHREKKRILGVKIVRGAYLEKENKRAQRMGYDTLMNSSKRDTDTQYDKALALGINNLDVVEFCAGTHNPESNRLLTELMVERNLPNNHPHIWFSQLYGMSDHISYSLANAGYNVCKYVPYGPVASTMPYLIRRARENTAIAGQMGQELKLLMEERNRRRNT